jgi:hypothetical protein
VLPALKENGFTDAEIHVLTVVNPWRAFAIGVREAWSQRSGGGSTSP